jgi:hypothetical protein
VFPISVAQADRALCRVQSWIDGLDGDTDYPLQGTLTLGRLLSKLRIVRAWAASLGGLPNFYAVSGGGRLYPTTQFHMVNLPQIARRLLLEGTGLKDFDIKSCHWSIFTSLARHLGITTHAVDSYLTAKAHHHSRWSTAAGLSSEDMKAVAISLLTGGTLWQLGNGARQARRARNALASDPLFREMRDEVTAGMVEVMKHAADTNAVGLPFPKDATKAQRHSHVLTGYEQLAVRTMCSRAPGLQAILYDGWLSPEVDPAPLLAAVRAGSQLQCGIELDLRLDIEDVSAPMADVKREPGDF